MRRALFAPLLVLSACVKPPTVHEGQVNPMPSEVQRVQTRMLDAMGGKSGWEKARYFEFDFGGIRNGQPAGTARRHHWDRFTGDYSLRFAQGTDTAYVVTNVNVAPLKGRAWINGREITGPRVDTLLTSAYARFINDSYWLLMPYKWSDPGVHTHYVGKQTDDKGVEKAPAIFEIDELRCVVCGLCVEACPCDAIRMDTGVHVPASDKREDFIFDKEKLMSIPGKDGSYVTANPRHEPGDPSHPGVDRDRGHH